MKCRWGQEGVHVHLFPNQFSSSTSVMVYRKRFNASGKTIDSCQPAQFAPAYMCHNLSLS